MAHPSWQTPSIWQQDVICTEMYMEKKGYGHRISIPQCIDTLFQKKKKKEGQRHHEDQRFKIIIKYVVNGIVINIIKNVHNLFAILFQRNPRL